MYGSAADIARGALRDELVGVPYLYNFNAAYMYLGVMLDM